MHKTKAKHHPNADVEQTRPAATGHPSATDAAASSPAASGPAAPADVAAAPPPPAKEETPTEKLEKLQDQLLRLRADFDNFRKRTLREKTELFECANQDLMLELLPVLDHLHLGLQAASAHEADPAFREGLQLIFDQLMAVLSKFGLTPIETENQVFDATRCEAVNTLPSATAPEGTVLAMVRRGYMLRNKLLRPTQVIVSSGPPPEEKIDASRQTPDDGRQPALRSPKGEAGTPDAGQEKTKEGCQGADSGKE
ncbi:MAG: nucleotide exchange factor GrpE [Lentisphaerae bacterium]|nr:nucleotide exchange factor GrpE [Lentisphaerota bacterium]